MKLRLLTSWYHNREMILNYLGRPNIITRVPKAKDGGIRVKGATTAELSYKWKHGGGKVKYTAQEYTAIDGKGHIQTQTAWLQKPILNQKVVSVSGFPHLKCSQTGKHVKTDSWVSPHSPKSGVARWCWFPDGADSQTMLMLSEHRATLSYTMLFCLPRPHSNCSDNPTPCYAGTDMERALTNALARYWVLYNNYPTQF